MSRQHRAHLPKPEPQCTVEELEGIITFPAGGMHMLPSRDLDEVWHGIYIGDEGSARNTYQLQRLGITHVLNAALGKTAYHVNTNHVYYRRSGIEWKGIEATDIMNFNLKPFFPETTAFIKWALESGGKVLVHCREGYSRSTTLVLAYLMTCCHMTVQDALRHVRRLREVGPNEGFLQQLCDYNEDLWKKGHFHKKPEQEVNKLDTGGAHSQS